MTIVRLTSWSPGFVANRLVRLLRDHGLGLAEAHDMATRLVSGEEVDLCFDDADAAESFASAARELGAVSRTAPAARVAS